MGNRSKVVVAAAAGVGLQTVRRAHRRARLRAAAEGIQQAILPTHTGSGVDEAPAAGEAHAPGHQHLGPDARHQVDTGTDRRADQAPARYSGQRQPDQG
jgi:hypothetical protein